MDFFYDGQIRRYLVQLMRAFSDLYIQNGPDENGTLTQMRVPILYGDPSWQVAQILQGGSQNTMATSPSMAMWIVSLELAPDRRRDPAHESSKNAVERKFDQATGTYGSEPGDRYTIERYMPVPYNLTVQLDIWTTTTTTKLQILEQIMMIFNPAVQLQQNSNIFDWTSIFEMEMTQITWTNRTVPQGTEQDRDVASIQFKVPIWISPPAKVTRIHMIEQIVTNVFNAQFIPEADQISMIEDPVRCMYDDLLAQIITTPGNFKVGVGTHDVAKNEVILLNRHGVADPKLSWTQLFSTYGINVGTAYLRLKMDKDIEVFDYDIIGKVIIDPERENVLKYEIDFDTLPDTIGSGPILDIIDPQKQFPGSNLPLAIAGQRYLLVSDVVFREEDTIPDKPLGPWGDLTAYENDIIEFNGRHWFVSFESKTAHVPSYVINLRTLNHYKFDGNEWVFTYLGEYAPGYWRIHHNNNSWVEGDSGGNEPPMCPPCGTTIQPT